MMTPGIEKELPLLTDVLMEELPKDYQTILDHNTALEFPERFVPTEIGSMVLPALALLFCVLFISLEIYELLQSGTSSGSHQTFHAILLLGFITAALFAWYKLWYAFNQRFSLLANLWKNGLHALPNALLLYDKQRCTLLPRHRILRMGYWSSGSSRNESRKTILIYRDKQGEEVAIPLAYVKFPDSGTTTNKKSSPHYYALKEWINSGEYPRYDTRSPFRPLSSLNQWMPVIKVGHSALNMVSIIAIVLLLALEQILGRTTALIVSILLGGTMFLTFPFLMGFIKKEFNSSADKRPPGWGYLFLLGIVAMILVITGFYSSSEWLRLEQAQVVKNIPLDEIYGYKNQSLFFNINDIRILPNPIGYFMVAKKRGESQSYNSYYVAPLVSKNEPHRMDVNLDKKPYCLWIGINTHDSSPFSLSKKKLITSQYTYFMEAFGADRENYIKAAEKVLKNQKKICELMVLEGMEAPEIARQQALIQLFLAFITLNIIPPFLMFAYILFQLDRPWHPGMKKVTND